MLCKMKLQGWIWCVTGVISMNMQALHDLKSNSIQTNLPGQSVCLSSDSCRQNLNHVVSWRDMDNNWFIKSSIASEKEWVKILSQLKLPRKVLFYKAVVVPRSTLNTIISAYDSIALVYRNQQTVATHRTSRWEWNCKPSSLAKSNTDSTKNFVIHLLFDSKWCLLF